MGDDIGIDRTPHRIGRMGPITAAGADHREAGVGGACMCMCVCVCCGWGIRGVCVWEGVGEGEGEGERDIEGEMGWG